MARVSYLIPTPQPNSQEGQARHNRQAVDVMRNLLNGHINSVGDFTLDASDQTTVSNVKLQESSIVYCMPKSAAAATIAPSFWFETAQGSFTVHHTATGGGQAFSWVALG